MTLGSDAPIVMSDPPLAIVGRIVDIVPHPNADRVELLDILISDQPYVTPHYMRLVAGKHYRIGDFGVWLRPGGLIPGWLAHDLWLVGKKRASEPFEVREIEIRGVASPGLWAGQWYRNDSSKESVLHAEKMAQDGGKVVDGWIRWPHWDPDWRLGDNVGDDLGVQPCPRSSEAEQRLFKPEVTVSQGIGTAQADPSAIPVAGSTTSNEEGAGV